MKEVEYSNSVKANNQPAIDLNKTTLTHLKEDLAATVKAFNSVPTDIPDSKSKSPKKTKRWWHSFLPLKPEANRK